MLTPRSAVWPAVGKAPNGAPDTSVAYGTSLAAGGSVSYTIGDTELVSPYLPWVGIDLSYSINNPCRASVRGGVPAVPPTALAVLLVAAMAVRQPSNILGRHRAHQFILAFFRLGLH